MKKLEYFILDVVEISKAEIEAFLKQKEADMKNDKKDYKKSFFSYHFNCPNNEQSDWSCSVTNNDSK